MKCYLTCPIEGTLVKISFNRSDSNGRIVGVHECSHLRKVGREKCAEVCVAYLNERVDRLQKQYEAKLSNEQTPSALEREPQTKDPQ